MHKRELITKTRLYEKINIGLNFTVFLLFFGMVLVEALESHSWLKAIFWVAISIVFLTADNPIKRGA